MANEVAEKLVDAKESDEVVPGYEIVVGLEVHCELSTKTKMFCGCANAFGSEPNTQTCPVCLGLPGSLPVLNARAVELAMRIGKALHCQIQPSTFHRKNYFYPDMPKDYQISQYDQPINLGGYLELVDGSRIGIVRAHLEEDTGKTTHVGGSGRIHGSDHSLVDYNRSGVPLVEIVSEPDIRSSEQARSYVSELRAILVATGASDGRMEEGSLRVDANVSVRRIGDSAFGTRCEVKNLNSLRSLGRAIEIEAIRQVELIESGGRVLQETRHFDEALGQTSSMRSKEEANDYRYFPEPDLVPLDPDDAWIGKATADIGLLPADRRRRLGELVPDASLAQIETVVDLGLDDLVVATVSLGADSRLTLARTANEAAREGQVARSLAPEAFVSLIGLEASGELSSTQAKSVLGELLGAGIGPASKATADTPSEIAKRLGFEALGTGALDQMLDEIITSHPGEWERFANGDAKVAQFFLGQVMKQSKGRANGKVVAEALAKRLAGQS